ncbi:MAG: hypothetical protein ACXWUL_06850 [Caldimonas sp.]
MSLTALPAFAAILVTDLRASRQRRRPASAQLIGSAAYTRGHIAYRSGSGAGDPTIVRRDTLLSARTWKNGYR